MASLAARIGPEAVSSLRLLIESIAAALPVEMIYSDYSTNPLEVSQLTFDETETLARLNSLRQALYGQGAGDAAAFLEIVKSTRLFDAHLKTAEKYAREAFGK